LHWNWDWPRDSIASLLLSVLNFGIRCIGSILLIFIGSTPRIHGGCWKLAIWEQGASTAQWSSRMIRASGVFPAAHVVKMYVTRVQFPVEPNDFLPSTVIHCRHCSILVSFLLPLSMWGQ